jgi:hypothetical protein
LLRHLLGCPLLGLDLLLQVGVVLADLGEPAFLGLQRVAIAAAEIGPLTYRLQMLRMRSWSETILPRSLSSSAAAPSSC